MEQTLQDRVVLLLTNGMSIEAAEAFCIRSGKDDDSARRTVAEARKRITVAADFARDEYLGKAVLRLDDLYAKSIAGQDHRTALQAQRELNRLRGSMPAGSRPRQMRPQAMAGSWPSGWLCSPITFCP